MTEIKKDHVGLPEDGILKLMDRLSMNLFSGELKDHSTEKSVVMKGKQLGAFLLLISRPDETVTHKTFSDAIWGDGDYDRHRMWQVADQVKNKLFELGLDYNPIITHYDIGYSYSTTPPINKSSLADDARKLY